MALTPELDGLAAQIANLESLVAALDGVTPINVTIGSYSLLVDPATMQDAYAKGSDVLRNVAQGAILSLRDAIASTVMVQSTQQ